MTSDLTQPLASLPDPLPIPRIAAGTKPFDATIRPPGSKSLTNRALLLAALANGISTLHGALTEAEDAEVMLAAIEQLGARVDRQRDGSLRIHGVNGEWKFEGPEVTLKLRNAGTATRFLAAAGLLTPPGKSVVIDGDRRMRERPISELVDAIRDLPGVYEFHGTSPEYLHREGFPPIRVHGIGRWNSSDFNNVEFGSTQSSQFISAVLLIAPYFRFGLTVAFTGRITSEPYVDMTVNLLRRAGAIVIDRRPASIHVGSTDDVDQRPLPENAPTVRGFDLDVEPDASGATYFHAAAALFPGARVTIPGLDLGPRGSLQGDTHFVRVLSAMGAQVERIGAGPAAALRVTGPARLTPIDADLADMPDTAMTAAVLCCFAEPTLENPTATSTLRGLRTLRVKETDRLAALQAELSKLGARVEIFRDGDDEGLRITPPPPGCLDPSMPRCLLFSTYNDHRMAMALALIGLRIPGVQIQNPGCVAKTYPGFWNDFARLTG
jgi:3-phosphoshikimate 1-carboxyvinyltransferase